MVTYIVNVLNATGMFTFKVVNFRFVNFTSVKKQKQNQNMR